MPPACLAVAAALRRAVTAPITKSILGVAIIVAAFVWGLPRFASYESVWHSLADTEPRFLAPLIAVGAFNLVAPSLTQRAALPGLTMPVALAVDWSTSAVTNTVPGGSAIATGMTWAMYRSIGLRARDIVRSVVVTGVWHTFVKFGTPLVALLWLSTERPVTDGLVNATIAGTALFIVVIVLGAVLVAGPTVADAIGGLLDRLPLLGQGWSQRLGNLRSDTVALLKKRWRSLTTWTLLGHIAYWLLLVICLRAVGVTSAQLSSAAVLAALAFGRLVTALPLTPGGLGVMELGLTSALTAVGDADQGAVVAAVLLFRFLTFAVPIPLGAVAWVGWTSRVVRETGGAGALDDDAQPAVQVPPSDDHASDERAVLGG